MLNEVWIDNDNQVLRQKLINDAILAEAPEYFTEVKRLIDTLPRRLAIVDLAKADESRLLKRESRKYIVKYSTTVGYKKLAYINVSPSLHIIAKVINNIVVKKSKDETELAIFDTEEQALDWLKGEE
ncbi:hypothetical protein JXM67_12260 [candidate division WOR-3 bacterium]|nr:hypothetical protein [candidate division WOR-3 bacterium]